MKKLVLMFLVFCLTVCGLGNAAGVYAASSDKVKIDKVTYKNDGKVEVVFKKSVSYNDVKVEVKDSAGKVYKTKILEKSKTVLVFNVSNTKANTKYTFTVSGIKYRDDSKYTSVSGSFKTSKDVKTGQLAIKNATYNSKENKLDVTFSQRVRYKRAEVTVTDSNGKSYSASVLRKGSRILGIRVKDLPSGKQYTVKISGIGIHGSNRHETLSQKFTG